MDNPAQTAPHISQDTTSETPSTIWRLILTPPGQGAWNMAVDEAILETTRLGQAPPTLRLYAWEPPCVSLGYAQPMADVDLEALEAHGWDLVRRPTGGRAVLHTDELTYSVCGPHTEPRLASSVLDSYRVLAGALQEALQRLGISVEAHSRLPAPSTLPERGNGEIDGKRSSTRQNPVCFEVSSNYEITVAGKKLLGSAQARRKEGVLQHGSLPLYGDLRRITQALAFPDEATRAEAAQRLLSHAATVEQILGRPLAWEQAAQAFARAFAERLNLKLEIVELTEGERKRADELVKEKYGNMVWTGRI